MSMDFSNLDFINGGWFRDDAEVVRIVTENAIITASQSLPPIGDKPQKLSFIPYLEKTFGSKWYRHQGTCGSCVANGAALAVDVLAAIDHVDNRAEAPKQADVCTIYWGSRIEIGKNRLGHSQGSVGVWAAQWLQQYGSLEMKNYGSIDLSTYSSSLCCGGHSVSGVPDDLEPIAKNHPVKVYAKVTNFDELIDALASGYPVTVASNQGFTQQRDSEGFASPRGTWQHQMCVIGYRLDRPGALIANSWGEYFSGSDLCRACFWVDKQTINRMLSQNDSWALSDLTGWPRKSLSFGSLNW